MAACLRRLQRRVDFLRVASGRRKHAAPGLVLQARRRPPGADARGKGAPEADDDQVIRFGLTASKKVGGAVVRNRARRRLRAAATQILPAHGAPGHDFVLIARATTATRPWSALLADLEGALRRLRAWRPGPGEQDGGVT